VLVLRTNLLTKLVFVCLFRHALFLRQTRAATVIRSYWLRSHCRRRFLSLRRSIVFIQVLDLVMCLCFICHLCCEHMLSCTWLWGHACMVLV